MGTKIGIVGCGHVGMAAAFALFKEGLASEMVLLDKDHERSEGEAMDLMHAQAYTDRCSVRAGDYSDLKDASYIVISAGVSQAPGETRLELLSRNVDVLRPIMVELDRYCPDAVIIMATNPVDILTYMAQELSSRAHCKIIGTGTMLDTSRFRSLIGDYYNIDPKSVHAYVVGEHGNSEVLLWSQVQIGGKKILGDSVLGKVMSDRDRDQINEKVTKAAYQIIERKGYTSWAIGLVISSLIKALSGDQRKVLPLSIRVEGEYGVSDTCMGLPCIVGSGGVEGKVDFEMSERERELLKVSGDLLSALIRDIK